MEEKNTSSFSPLLPPLSSPPPPPPSPSSLSIPTITNDFSFFNDTFFKKSFSDLVNVRDFGPSLYEWLNIAEEDNPPAKRPVKHPLPSLPPNAVILESSKISAQSQNPTFSIIPFNPDVVVANNNNTNRRVAGLKHSTKFIIGENENLRGAESNDEENNIITRLKLRASMMASIAATMSMNNKRNKNNIPKFRFSTRRAYLKTLKMAINGTNTAKNYSKIATSKDDDLNTTTS